MFCRLNDITCHSLLARENRMHEKVGGGRLERPTSRKKKTQTRNVIEPQVVGYEWGVVGPAGGCGGSVGVWGAMGGVEVNVQRPKK